MCDGGCRPPLPAPCIRCARAVRRGRGAFRSGVRRAHWLTRVGTVRGAGATRLPLLGASRTRFTAAGARFSAGRQPSSPAGRVTAPLDRLVRTTLVRFRVSVRPFSVRWSRRAVRGLPSPDHPAAAFFALPAPIRYALAPVRFFDASRLPGISFVRGTPPCGSFAAGFVHGGVPGPRAVLATWAGRGWRPADARGVRLYPSQRYSWRAVGGAFRAPPGPPAVWSVPSPRVFSLAGARQAVAGGRGSVVRLLGVRPAAKPFPAVHRPRYSFCAEGRRDARAVAALGFEFLCQAFGVAGRGSPLLEPFRRGLSSAARSSLQRPGTSRWSACPWRCAGPRA